QAQDLSNFSDELNDTKAAASNSVAVPVAAPAPAGEAIEEAPAEMPEWLVMVFMNGRNDLWRAAIKDVNEMEKIGSTAKIAVTVELGLLQDKGNSTRFFIQKDDTSKIKSPSTKVMNSDMGSYKHFVNFAKWSIRRHQAKRYMVILWSHGSGRVDIGGADNTGAELGISYDDLTRNFIRNSQIAMALKEISQYAGKKIDVYSSDACLMQMLSVAYEIKDHASYLVQSEERVPDFGFPYDTILTSLNANPAVSAAAASKIIVDRFNAFYKANKPGSTISAINSSAFKGFNSPLNSWIRQAVKSRAEVLKAIEGALSFERGYDGVDTTYNARSKDLYDFIENVNAGVDKKSELYRAGIVLQKYINGSLVVYNKTTNNYMDYSRTKGLAVYFPKMIYDTSYDEMLVSRDTLWDDFIKWTIDESYEIR
ncbi:MAG: clostripain-related cysteine peptidase, partial [Elusimicrobiota bacterium]|nr:clostripain-related cysteine peptidase [Elusimicrobiota bacterium]